MQLSELVYSDTFVYVIQSGSSVVRADDWIRASMSKASPGSGLVFGFQVDKRGLGTEHKASMPRLCPSKRGKQEEDGARTQHKKRQRRA
jgi:hypothetical protein